jgi:hypothetical protein
MSDTIEARVARGAAWLDSVHPGWERRIDLSTLDLALGCRCVLGQIWADKATAHQTGFGWARKLLPDDEESLVTPATAHGFAGVGTREVRALDEAWIALLKERFASGLLSDEAS